MLSVRFPPYILALRGAGAALASFAILAAAACSSSSSPPAASPPSDAGLEDLTPTRPAETAVSPLFIGSGGFGFGTGSGFPGAAAPQGIAKLGPDTSGPWGTINFLHCSGYWYGDNVIQGFSHMHLHGTGVPDYGVLGIMPVPSFDASMTTMAGYQSNFDKSTESAVPGKYTVTLAEREHPRRDDGHAARGPPPLHLPVLRHDRARRPRPRSPHRERNGRHGECHARSVHEHAHAAASSRRAACRGDSAGARSTSSRRPRSRGRRRRCGARGTPAAGTTAQGTGVGVDLDFDRRAITRRSRSRWGCRSCRRPDAAANLAAEMPSFAFDAEAAATAAAWKKATSVVQVQGGTATQQSMMQAAALPPVSHALDPERRGRQLRRASTARSHMAQGFHYVSELSLWDTYRTLMPLLDLIDPARSLDTVQSLVAMSKQGGFFPKWPIGDGEAGTMIGASAEVVIADAYVKGLRRLRRRGRVPDHARGCDGRRPAVGRSRRHAARSCRTCNSATCLRWRTRPAPPSR